MSHVLPETTVMTTTAAHTYGSKLKLSPNKMPVSVNMQVQPSRQNSGTAASSARYLNTANNIWRLESATGTITFLYWSVIINS